MVRGLREQHSFDITETTSYLKLLIEYMINQVASWKWLAILPWVIMGSEIFKLSLNYWHEKKLDAHSNLLSEVSQFLAAKYSKR